MTHSDELATWIDANMPELSRDLASMSRPDRTARLNALTGANVRSCDTIEDGAAKFLAAFQYLTGEP